MIFVEQVNHGREKLLKLGSDPEILTLVLLWTVQQPIDAQTERDVRKVSYSAGLNNSQITSTSYM